MATFQDRISQLFDESKDTDYKLTKDQFALKYGGSRSQLNGWLAGKGEPGSEMLKRISETFNVSVDWLVGKSNLRSPHPTTIALSRSDDPDSDLPDEALKQIDDFRAFIRQKYKKPD